MFSFVNVNNGEYDLSTDDYQTIEADEATFLDLVGSGFWTGLNYSMTN